MSENCTVYKTVEVIGKKWSLLIILNIYKSNNKSQFNAIKRDLHSITAKILSKRLKELEAQGIVIKEIDNSKKVINTYYSLTNSGEALIKIINEIKKWGFTYKFQNDDCKSILCKNCKI